MCDCQTTSEMLTVKQAAQEAAVSEKTIRRYINSGELQAQRLGSKTVRIYRRDLHAMFNPMPQNGTSIGVIIV